MGLPYNPPYQREGFSMKTILISLFTVALAFNSSFADNTPDRSSGGSYSPDRHSGNGSSDRGRGRSGDRTDYAPDGTGTRGSGSASYPDGDYGSDSDSAPYY